MTQEQREQFNKRFKSFLWRIGMMALSGFVAFLATNLNLFNMPAEITIVVGLVLGEVSKFLNTEVKAQT